jgi:hypothetical protein
MSEDDKSRAVQCESRGRKIGLAPQRAKSFGRHLRSLREEVGLSRTVVNHRAGPNPDHDGVAQGSARATNGRGAS